MTDFSAHEESEALSRVETLVQSALHECDRLGLLVAALQFSSALDKLMELRSEFKGNEELVGVRPELCPAEEYARGLLHF